MLFQEIPSGFGLNKGIQKLTYVLLKGWKLLGQED
jgi:hypothetical protein